jgi:hypothetical protein
MGLFNKLKNILFEEEEIEVPVITKDSKEKRAEEVRHEEPVSEPSRFKNVVKKEEVKVEEPAVSETSELPKQIEKSPFLSFDEEEFERIAAVNKSRLLERDRKAREEKEKVEQRKDTPVYNQTKYVSPISAVKKEEVKVEPHRFKPSPVISPVYGILDKNYKKEDILPKASSEGTLPKMMDVDSVRKKAFGVLEENDVLNKFDEPEEDKSVETLVLTSLPDEKEEQEPLENNLIKTTEIKITSFEDQIDDKEELPEDNYVAIDDELPEDEETLEPKNEEVKKSNVSDDTLESDLFNLIDSMYDDKENK